MISLHLTSSISRGMIILFRQRALAICPQGLVRTHSRCSNHMREKPMIPNQSAFGRRESRRESRADTSINSTTHTLKCWPEFFEAILDGKKTHDLRRSDDRTFRIGDFIRLREFDPRMERYTGREQTVEITYITSADVPCALSEKALDSAYCILSIRKLA